MLQQELQKQLDARQAFAAKLGQGGFPGGKGTATGLAAVKSFQEQIRKEAQDLAFLQREGLISETDAIRERQRIIDAVIQQGEALQQEFRDTPAVIDAVQRSVDKVQFGNFGAQLADGRQFIDQTIITIGSLQDRLFALDSQLNLNVPRSVDTASAELRKLNADFRVLERSVYAAVTAVQTMSGALAAGMPTEQ
jgi:hypothetical protein